MENKDTKERLERLNRVSDSEKALNEIMIMYFDDLDATFTKERNHLWTIRKLFRSW